MASTLVRKGRLFRARVITTLLTFYDNVTKYDSSSVGAGGSKVDHCVSIGLQCCDVLMVRFLSFLVKTRPLTG